VSGAAITSDDTWLPSGRTLRDSPANPVPNPVADNSRAPDSGGTGEQLIKSATERQDPIGGDYLSGIGLARSWSWAKYRDLYPLSRCSLRILTRRPSKSEIAPLCLRRVRLRLTVSTERER
jgi:hypothetical protein